MLEPALVIRQKPFKNNSKIIDFFTRDSGIITAVAKGINRPKSNWAGILQYFNLVDINYVGKKQLKTLTEVELVNDDYKLNGLSLYCGFYLNELLISLLNKEEPYVELFKIYQNTLIHLKHKQNININLRSFEFFLLKSIGLGFDLNYCSDGSKINKSLQYVFNNGWEEVDLKQVKSSISGDCLKYLDNPSDEVKADCLTNLKYLMRQQISLALEGKKLQSRALLSDYLRVKNNG